MNALRFLAVLALLGCAGCGGDGGTMPLPPDQSLLTVRVTFDGIDIRQLNVHVHAANVPVGAAHDVDLPFPSTPSPSAIPSGSTLGIIYPKALMDTSLDLTIDGYNGQAHVATGSKQAPITPGTPSTVTVNLVPPMMP